MTYDSAGEGWAVGGLASSGTIPWAILRSRDGGRSWGVQEVLNGSPEKTFTQVLALRDGSLVILGREGRCSKDGGRTWIKRAPLPSILRAVSPEGRILIGLGDRGRDLWHSEDGGASWRSAVLPELPADSALADLSFADARNGWCVGSSGSGPLLLQTRDGGRRWTLAAALGLPEAGVFSAVQFQDAQIGFLSSEGARPEGSSRLHCTKDGGGTWTPAWEGEEGARISRLSRLPGGGVLAVGARRGRAFVLTLEPGP